MASCLPLPRAQGSVNVSRMIVHCLRCGATTLDDPDAAGAHVCDAPGRPAEPTPRGDDMRQRLVTLEFEARSRLNALERRVRELGGSLLRSIVSASCTPTARAPLRICRGREVVSQSGRSEVRTGTK
jgi:hypothetical protein